MRVLVTGAAGFIGRQVLPALAGRAQEVHALSRVEQPETAGVRWHRTDLFDRERTEGLVREIRATHLIHCAWYTDPPDYWSSPENLTWLAASADLIRAFAESGGARAVLVGTCAEYDWGCGVCHEGSPTRPATLYGTAKLALWNVVSSYARSAELQTACARVFHVYGPGEPAERFVSSVLRHCLAGTPAECTAGTQVRDFLHVRDVGSALAAITSSELTGVVNVGSGSRVELREVASAAADAAGRPDLLRLGARPTAPADPPLLVPAVERLHGELGWRPRVGLAEGLAEYVQVLRGASAPASATAAVARTPNRRSTS